MARPAKETRTKKKTEQPVTISAEARAVAEREFAELFEQCHGTADELGRRLFEFRYKLRDATRQHRLLAAHLAKDDEIKAFANDPEGVMSRATALRLLGALDHFSKQDAPNLRAMKGLEPNYSKVTMRFALTYFSPWIADCPEGAKFISDTMQDPAYKDAIRGVQFVAVSSIDALTALDPDATTRGRAFVLATDEIAAKLAEPTRELDGREL